MVKMNSEYITRHIPVYTLLCLSNYAFMIKRRVGKNVVAFILFVNLPLLYDSRLAKINVVSFWPGKQMQFALCCSFVWTVK